EAAAHAPARAGWRLLPGTVHHGFTHFALDIRVAVGRVARPRRDPAEARWVAPDGFAAHALPTLTKKLARFVAAHCRGTG
ncbi:MAG: A/G-specific adenine glycosylase, partial [Alphaproteobacteria bacterium]|nr:A/G-specific adenine glycosylase [Alphaproteobacteria bacterium]